jgi:ferritin-like metal-binding protein YciE
MRPEEVLQLPEQRTQGKKKEVMEGLIKKGESTVENTGNSQLTTDAGIILAARNLEHSKIFWYGTLIIRLLYWVQDEIANLLSQKLEQEKETDAVLTKIAERNIN